MSTSMLLKPRMSEKAYSSAMVLNTYVFDVPMTANKTTIADAVTAQFNVEVVDVRVVINKGKTKKSYQKRSRPVEGKRASAKHAYVRLKAGDSINLFGEPEQAEVKADKKAETKAKAVKAKKETK